MAQEVEKVREPAQDQGGYSGQGMDSAPLWIDGF